MKVNHPSVPNSNSSTKVNLSLCQPIISSASRSRADWLSHHRGWERKFSWVFFYIRVKVSAEPKIPVWLHCMTTNQETAKCNICSSKGGEDDKLLRISSSQRDSGVFAPCWWQQCISVVVQIELKTSEEEEVSLWFWNPLSPKVCVCVQAWPRG